MRVYVQVDDGDHEVKVTLTPETYDLMGDDIVRSTVGPTTREVVEQAARMALAALEQE